MSDVTWSNTAPVGRSYRDHLKGVGGGDHPTFRQVVHDMGGGPVEAHPSLAFAFQFCGIPFSVVESLGPGNARIGGVHGSVLRVTGL